MQLQSFDATARKRLAALLDAKAENGNSMRCDEVQGFMLALLSGPDSLNTAEWLPEILADEQLFSEEERKEVEALVLSWAVDMREKLVSGSLPELCLYEDEGGSDFYTWCNAYLYALDVVPTDWFEKAADDDFEDLFYPVMALGGIYDEEDEGQIIITFTDKELAQLESDLPHALLGIYRYWQSVINKPQTVRREGDKIGRNDLCPCGSGKKYKACCARVS
ncbi:YecA family protein [Uruburuella testudinis]|uniref:YecA family protein n=1 Tax=Uruburuella testudinis TaxID=1282863 RepID=A0ABY4DWA8_9NEIS|nr:YecA family protein [Uruburuella testudinis]UOO83111.1 YecA family protein [Uruburuella testudinis]